MLIRYINRPGSRLGYFVALGALLAPCALLVADDRPATLAEAGGNPLALNAGAFLGWYWTMLLMLASVAVLLRLFGGGLHARSRPSAGLVADTYAMAYLAGGPQRVLDVVMASLVNQGALRVNAVTRELIAEQELFEDRPIIERRVRAQLGGSHRVDNAARFRRWLQRELRPSLALMRDRLLHAGLLARPALQGKALKPLMFGFALLLGIGAIRLVAGVAAGRPVGFLVISMLATGVVAWWLLRGMGRERTTVQGQRFLKECRSRLGRGGDDKLWMVALLGLAGYGIGPMADLHHVMQLPTGGFLFGGVAARKATPLAGADAPGVAVVEAAAAGEAVAAETWSDEQAALWQRIRGHPLDDPGASLCFSRRLARDNIWSQGFAERVIDEYRRFVFLAMVAGHPVTPSDQVDQAWHLHLLYTRDYWGTFTELLPRQLHHGPTLGGATEGRKFSDWYSKTLHSYWRLFGEHPPIDVWPPAVERFGRDVCWLRVNGGHHWLIPRPGRVWQRFRRLLHWPCVGKK